MSNTAYLCCCNFDGIYPSYRVRGFNPQTQTIACCPGAVPLLWLALFRPNDIRREQLIDDESGEAFEEEAPVVERTRAIQRLPHSLQRLDALFAKKCGSLAEHLAHLEEALSSCRGRFLTLEIAEIADLHRHRASFYRQFRGALEVFESDATRDARGRLVKISTIHADRRFIPPVELFSPPKAAPSDLQNLTRLLGTGHLRAVPWENVELPRSPDPKRQEELNARLLKAIDKGDGKGAQRALDAGADPNARGDFNHTCLELAAAQGNVDILSALVRAGANLSSPDPVVAAAEEGHLNVIKRLRQLGCDVTVGKAVAVAAHRREAEVVRYLVKAGADLNYSDRLDDPPLFAVVEGLLPKSMLATLLKAGADIDVVTAHGKTALATACWRGHGAMVPILLKHGAHQEIAGTSDRTPLSWAAYNGSLDLVQTLVEAGASEVNVGVTYRSISKEYAKNPQPKWKDVLAFLETRLKSGVELPPEPPQIEDLERFNGAIRRGDIKRVEEMLAKWPQIDKEDLLIGGPLHVAAHAGKVELVKLFLRRGLDVNSRNEDNNTPLHWAAQFNRREVVELLLAAGADINAEDNDGDTPTALAKGSVKKLLLARGGRGETED